MNNPDSGAIVRLEAVRKSFRSGADELQVLKHVDLTVKLGESVSIVGASGCGKSTLLNLIGGLESADGGLIKVGEYMVSEMAEREMTVYRSSNVGFVFQLHYLLKDFTALENVMLPKMMLGCRHAQAVQAAHEGLERVRVDQRANHYPSQLSGGERQRVALARALINDPSVVLADEPTGNLDESHKNAVRDILFSMIAKAGKTLILVTHSRDLARHTDRSMHLTDGRLDPV